MEVPISKENLINVYWVEEKQFLEFKAIDKDNNSLLDTVEWIAPHLSTQNFQIIIEIKDAELLDENKTLIRNVYDELSKQDDFGINITSGQYVRATFEKPLDSTNDITIHASGNNSIIEIYEANGTELIAKFEEITNDSNTK